MVLEHNCCIAKEQFQLTFLVALRRLGDTIRILTEYDSSPFAINTSQFLLGQDSDQGLVTIGNVYLRSRQQLSASYFSAVAVTFSCRCEGMKYIAEEICIIFPVNILRAYRDKYLMQHSQLRRTKSLSVPQN
jgi:hypothetical protein